MTEKWCQYKFFTTYFSLQEKLQTSKFWFLTSQLKWRAKLKGNYFWCIWRSIAPKHLVSIFSIFNFSKKNAGISKATLVKSHFGSSSVNLRCIFRKLFSKNISGGLLLSAALNQRTMTSLNVFLACLAKIQTFILTNMLL